MAKNPFACSECHMILPDGVDQCPHHPAAQSLLIGVDMLWFWTHPDQK